MSWPGGPQPLSTPVRAAGGGPAAASDTAFLALRVSAQTGAGKKAAQHLLAGQEQQTPGRPPAACGALRPFLRGARPGPPACDEAKAQGLLTSTNSSDFLSTYCVPGTVPGASHQLASERPPRPVR